MNNLKWSTNTLYWPENKLTSRKFFIPKFQMKPQYKIKQWQTVDQLCPFHPIKFLKRIRWRIWTAKDRYESADVLRRANQFYLHFSSRHYSESLATSNGTTQHWHCEWNSVEMYLKRLLTACHARSVLNNEAFAINSKLLFNLVVLMHLPLKCTV